MTLALVAIGGILLGFAVNIIGLLLFARRPE